MPVNIITNKVTWLKRLCPLLGLLIYCQFCFSQVKLEFGASSGMMFYQGDLSPSSIRGSISGGNLFLGLSTTLYPVRFVGLEVYATRGKLSGSDSNSLSEGRKQRNLSFESPLTEIGLKINFEIPIRLSQNNHRISPVGGIGYGQIKFNPQSQFNGQTVDLQPLGTEGQGLIGSGQEFYSLTTWSVPVFGGLRYTSGSNWTISVLLVQHFTGTDYLDDVSQNYPDLDLLEQTRGSIARQLSDRNISDGDRSGGARGDPKDNDSYVNVSIKIGKVISFGGRNKFGRRRGKYMKCPTF